MLPECRCHMTSDSNNDTISKNHQMKRTVPRLTSGNTPPPSAAASTARQAFSNISRLCSLHWYRARCTSDGFRAWACGRQDRANSAATRTMVGSRPLDARSAKEAASGGVRCPSHVSMIILMAALPISMAWPTETQNNPDILHLFIHTQN